MTFGLRKKSQSIHFIDYSWNYRNTKIYFHLKEIRVRIFYLIFSVFFTFFFCYLYRFECIYIFSKPFLKFQKQFIFTDLTEAFSATYIICGIFTVLLIIPLLYYQIWCFIIPSLFLYERNKFTVYTFILLFLYIFSNIVIYFFIIPEIVNFFLYFQVKSDYIDLRLEPRIYSYVILTFRIYLLFVCVFQIPFFIYFFFFRIIKTLKLLTDNRKFILTFFLLVGAIICPPDIVSQLVIVFFFIIIFEVSLWCGFFSTALEMWLCRYSLQNSSYL